MNTKNRLSYQKISLAIVVAYSICVAVFLRLYIKKVYPDTTFIRVFAAWSWMVAPQCILLLYVSRFLTRWAQAVSLLLQVALCFSLYDYSIPALADGYKDIKYEDALLVIPIWHYAIVCTTGLIMKIVQDY